jgi:hypothetical protein
MTTNDPTLDDLAAAAAAIATAIETRDALIVRLALNGKDRPDLCAASGLGDDRVREIERAGGVPPRKRGPRPQHRAK